MTEAERDLRERRNRAYKRMTEIMDAAKGESRSATAAEAAEFDDLETRLQAMDRALETHKNARSLASDFDYADPNAVLKPEQRFADWLNAQPDARSQPADFDTSKYWRGMATGDWRNADAEQRASMQEGVSADGGYTVPSPVAAQIVDMLRDQLAFMAGEGNTVPWTNGGSTLALPVWVTDPAVQNPAETVDSFPPPTDATVNRYLFVARPYMEIETVSWELMEDSALNIGDVLAAAMTARMARSIQSDFIYGAGAGTIQGFTTLGTMLASVEGGGVNGAAPASATGYDAIDKAIESVRSAKAEPDLIVTSPRALQTYGRLKNTLNDAIRPSPAVQDFLSGANGKEVRTTTAVKDTQTVGTSSADCSDLFVMDSSRIYWAIRHQASMLTLKERFASMRLAGVMMWLRLDATLTHPEASA